MAYWILLILVSILNQCQSLHMLQTLIYNQQRYLNALQEIQQRFRKDFEKVKINLETFKKELAATQGDDKARLKLLKRGLANQRDQLVLLESYVKLPYGLKACRCKGFTDDLKSATNSNLEMLSNSIQKLTNQLLPWPNCRITRQLRSQVLREQQYTAIIKDIANSPCHRPPKSFLPDQPSGLVNINESQYTSNLDGTKWIYGSLSPSDYKYKVFSLSTKTNLTKCPIEKPFTRNGRQCISCPENNPIWNVADSICTSCAVGEHYNPNGHNCSTGNIEQQERLAKSKGLGIYGEDKKNSASGYNRNRHGANYINDAPEIDPDLKTCPINQPFFNGKACVACRLPKVFNFDTLACENCPSGTNYNIKRKICTHQVLVKNLTNLQARNLIVGEDRTLEQLRQQQQQKLSLNPEYSICSLEKPYFDGQICITCIGSKPFFNLNSQQCENCDPGYSYFQSINKCTINIYVTNSLAKKIIQDDKHTIASIYQQASNLKSNNPNHRLQMCPLDKPFANKNFVCINCPQQYPLFDLSKKQCSKCPDQTIYDQQLSRCIGKFITSPNAPNLYYKGISKQSYIQQYNHLKNKYPSIKDCPTDSPYFDGTNCVSCAQSTPIFSLLTKMCGQCPVGKVYNSWLGDCVDQNST